MPFPKKASLFVTLLLLLSNGVVAEEQIKAISLDAVNDIAPILMSDFKLEVQLSDPVAIYKNNNELISDSIDIVRGKLSELQPLLNMLGKNIITGDYKTDEKLTKDLVIDLYDDITQLFGHKIPILESQKGTLLKVLQHHETISARKKLTEDDAKIVQVTIKALYQFINSMIDTEKMEYTKLKEAEAKAKADADAKAKADAEAALKQLTDIAASEAETYRMATITGGGIVGSLLLFIYCWSKYKQYKKAQDAIIVFDEIKEAENPKTLQARNPRIIRRKLDQVTWAPELLNKYPASKTPAGKVDDKAYAINIYRYKPKSDENLREETKLDNEDVKQRMDEHLVDVEIEKLINEAAKRSTEEANKIIKDVSNMTYAQKKAYLNPSTCSIQ